MSRKRRGGQSALEVILFLPWIVFIFVGAFDMGIYAHALISVENAARIATLYTSTSSSTAGDSTGACTYALGELKIAANVGSGVTTCTALPVIVTATSLTTTSADGQPASQVSVTYQTVNVIPIPGLLGSQFTFARTCQMRLRS